MSEVKLPKHRVQSHSKYLLYIDILGFSALVRKRPEVIPALYHIVATANMQKHGDFRTIVFSDTIVVYNACQLDGENQGFIVMFLCEFCQDLFYRLSAIDVFFRAVITQGEFEHFELGKSSCFYGAGLIEVYRREKQIKSVGTFLDSRLLSLNSTFETVFHSQDLQFVLLAPQISQLAELSWEGVPHVDFDRIPGSDALLLKREIKILEKMYMTMAQDRDPEVRSKHSVAWHYYLQRYGTIMARLVREKFDPSFIDELEEWDEPDDDEGWTLCPKRMTNEQYGYALCFELTTRVDAYQTEVTEVFLKCLLDEKFTGRCEYYHRVGRMHGVEPYAIAVGLKDMDQKSHTTDAWGQHVEMRMTELLATRDLRIRQPGFSELVTMKSIRASFAFCGTAKFTNGKPTYIVEHADDAEDGAFCDVVKEVIYQK